ncbi:hypothetical protein [Paenibacillus crassostreae]|uniref:Uncharacterized protein n=1 Tax=Paenibacillus crassostreae TaxID=1763538 RepID=A0A167FTW4_9BACL|nr:hypothetical protein [Paenibacillus crassostreae]AOZ94069.1 hypothetical protein LPB68_19015 [Paenibacillus crassostreae]OAB76895.1 hypothetical protein PNBC_05725 [Paenibacillus crassostreae]
MKKKLTIPVPRNRYFVRGYIKPSAASITQTRPVFLYAYNVQRNANFRARCGCSPIGTCNSLNRGTSFCTVDYNAGVPAAAKYRIKVYIKHYGREYYNRGDTNFETIWRRFINAPSSYNHFTTAILDGPGSPGRAGYFQNDNNDTPGPNTGTLGLQVFDRTTNPPVTVYRALWYFDQGFANFGREWLRCGHDYAFLFRDTP